MKAALIQPSDLTPPDKPSIAVLPFANVSDGPQQEYFADGMTDGLVTELARISGLFVIARNSTFAYKSKAVTAEQVSKELEVRLYSGGQRATRRGATPDQCQLVDSQSGGHAWAGKFNGTLADVFALQDEVTGGIADALALGVARKRRFLRLSMRSCAAGNTTGA